MGISNTTPNAVDGFTRYGAEEFDEREIIGASTGFQALFGNPANGSQTLFSPDKNAVDVDIIRGNERTAALLPRGTVSRPLGTTQRNMTEGKYTSFSRKFPLSEEEGDISGDQITNRMPGETASQTRTRLERLRGLSVKIYHEAIRRHVRLFEILAASSILNGNMPAILGTTNTDLIYDFKRNSDHAFSAGTAWDDDDPDILGDIDTCCNLIRANGKVRPDFMGIGGTALKTMLLDETFRSYCDKQRYNFVQAGMGLIMPPQYQRLVDAGWIFQGVLRTPVGHELYIFTYMDVYEDSDGEVKFYLPEDEAFITSTRARFDRYFGPPEMLPLIPARVQMYQELLGFNLDMAPMPPRIQNPSGVINPAMFYLDAYASADWKRLTIRCQSAPIFATTQTDAVVHMDNLLT